MKEWQPGAVKLGIDELRKATSGKKLALMLNHTALANNAKSLLDIMAREWECDISFLLGMEHGVRGNLYAGDSNVEGLDAKTGLPVENLYKYPGLRPPPELLTGLDAVVFCARDAGVRHWTWTPWLIYLMDAAAKAGVEVILLDQPNPLTGTVIEGGSTKKGYYSLIGAFAYALRHGMTQGELAAMYNQTHDVGCDLDIIRFEGWQRGMFFDETGIFWIPLVSNLPNLESLLGYATVGLLQNTSINFGRGSIMPFQVAGAPWLDAERLADHMNSLDLPGVFFSDIYYTPHFSIYAGQVCYGLRFTVTDRSVFSPLTSLVNILTFLVREYKDDFHFVDAGFDSRAGSPFLRKSLLAGRPAGEILACLKEQADEFAKLRQPFLLY